MFAGRDRLRVAAVRVQFRDATHGRYLMSYDSAGLRSRPLDPPPISDDTERPSPDQPSGHLAFVAHFDRLEH